LRRRQATRIATAIAVGVATGGESPLFASLVSDAGANYDEWQELLVHVPLAGGV
jgi:hypothetical protein